MSLGSIVGGTSHTLVTLQVPVTTNLLQGSLGVVRIGELLKSMDIAACMSAERHSLSSSVTLSMDDVNFSDARARSGDVVVIRSRVNRAFKSSMEVGLRVEIETPETGQTRHLCSSYFVFVALDSDGRKVEVPPLTPLTDKEKVRWALAGDRRQIRLDQAKIIQQVLKDKPSGLRYSVSGSRNTDSNGGSLGIHHNNNRSSVVRFGELDDKRNEVTQMVLPQHANHYGNTFGGQVMCWAHEVAETAAARHARCSVVTVSVDDMFFLAPSKVGTRVVLKASVNRVFNRSMEVGVRVEGHHLNGDIVLINRAYFTLVAVENPMLTTIPPLSPVGGGASSPPLPVPSALPMQKLSNVSNLEEKKSGSFFAKKKKPSQLITTTTTTTQQQTDVNAAPPSGSSSNQPNNLSRAESSKQMQPIRSVPLNTPDQVRRHQEALGRRRIRLERLQLKKSNHLAWPFTPETNPRSFALENLRALEKVTLESENAPRLFEDKTELVAESSIPANPAALNRGVWGLVAETDGIKVWSKASIHHGVSMKSQCIVKAPFEALVFAVWDVGSRAKWDKVVTGFEVRHRFESIDSDICWLAVDMRAVNPSSKPTDFALLRSWRRQGDSFVIASHSVVHHSVPATTNHIRAETASSGFILREIGNGLVEVMYVVQLNQSGTSIVAGDLVGTSKIYAMRMKELHKYASSLHPEVYADTIRIFRAPSNVSSLTSGDFQTGANPNDRNCTVM